MVVAGITCGQVHLQFPLSEQALLPLEIDVFRRGLAKACWKRPITEDDIEGVITTLETELYGSYESDVPSGILGARLMELLRLLDQIAYVRFASVYREFKDVRDFVDELEPHWVFS